MNYFTTISIVLEQLSQTKQELANVEQELEKQQAAPSTRKSDTSDEGQAPKIKARRKSSSKSKAEPPQVDALPGSNSVEVIVESTPLDDPSAKEAPMDGTESLSKWRLTCD